ncbi:MAG TPA: hypothetical protein VML19_35890 [Verrucomicrobiae bacterium]|nr:hypothetical protein [Verrucomicrobiae bacterium]
MPKSREPGGDRKDHENREHEEHERHEEERPRRRRMGREHAVHQQIVEKRLGGGAPATPEAYAEALKQWQQLPGSVVRPPTDQKPAETPAPDPDQQTPGQEKE